MLDKRYDRSCSWGTIGASFPFRLRNFSSSPHLMAELLKKEGSRGYNGAIWGYSQPDCAVMSTSGVYRAQAFKK